MSSERLNILWICTDSQRWDTLGCYGNPYVQTPNLDRLSKEGVIFDHCYAQNPLCTPSRGSFLTGRYPSCTALRDNGQNIRPSEVPVTKLLADAGWICGLSGKLHLSACNRRFQLGDTWWEYPNSFQVVQGCEPRIDDGYCDTEFHWDHSPVSWFRSSAYVRWVESQGKQIDYPPREDFPDVKQGMPPELHQTFWCAQQAIDFIEAYKDHPTPWLFSVNIFDPHFPVNPPDAYFKRYLEFFDEIPLPPFHPEELDTKPYFHRRQNTGKVYGGGLAGATPDNPKGEPHRHRALRAGYWAMCDFIDVQVGRLLDALERTGQRENTIIIFTSDHGELLGDHGMYIKGPILYDPALRVPLIIAGPGIQAGRRIRSLVELSDLAPTILELTGLPPYKGMQTQSLVPLLHGKTDRIRDDVYCEYTNLNQPGIMLSMIRTEEWKLVNVHGGKGTDAGELYNLVEDPNEHWNLWNDPRYQEIKTTLLKRLCDRQMYAAADPLPERVGIY